MKVIIINGSHRQGNSDLVISELKKIGKDLGLKIDELRLRDIEIKLPDGCEHCAESERCPNIKDEFEIKWLEKVGRYDGCILVTPTWSDGPTPLTKIFINRVVCFSHPNRMWWKNKKIGIITHGMAGEKSWQMVINWIKSVCVWMEAKFSGSYVFKSNGKVGTAKFSKEKLREFLLSVVS